MDLNFNYLIYQRKLSKEYKQFQATKGDVIFESTQSTSNKKYKQLQITNAISICMIIEGLWFKM
jgi:hypothetical protein